jgi:iron complex transport system ATP-binding protein
VNAVSVAGVSVVRDGRRLLGDVSLEAAAGSVVGVVGPNGAGKSTLLRVVAGDIHPDSGSVAIGDVNVATAGLRHLALLRAFVGPHVASDVAFRVGEVVAMGRHPLRQMPSLEGRDDVVVQAMAALDVADLGDRVMRTLSSGEQQRVQLARAIAQQTPVVLLDEPTSALDVGHQETVMSVLRALADDGIAVVAVLHDLNLAAAGVDQLLLLDHGRAAAAGTPQQVLTSELLSAAYRYPMQVIEHPFRDCPLVLSSPSERGAGASAKPMR